MKEYTFNYPVRLKDQIEQQPLASIKNEFLKAFPPFVLYLATIIILLSFFKDMARVGFNPSWLCIRALYFPFVWIIWHVSIKKINRNCFYEIPLWAAGLYITSFCTYFSFSTGGLKSDYIYGLIQFYFGIAVMPVTRGTFYTLTLTSIIIYVGSNILKFGGQSLHDQSAISNLIPLLIFSVVVFYITSKMRNAKINLQNTLSKTLIEREEKIKIQSKKLAEIETKSALSLVAAQMAHDIRSPLAVLNIVASGLAHLPDDISSMVRAATTRINDIANNMLNKYKQNTSDLKNDELSCELIHSIIDNLVSEKRLQYQNKILLDYIIECDAEAAIARIQVIEFKRMLSNLINNASEAMDGVGKINITLSLVGDKININIKDHGCGIQPSDLKNLYIEGNTTKKMGSGLGLFHAKKTMEDINGRIHIDSSPGVGTTVSLTLLRV